MSLQPRKDKRYDLSLAVESLDDTGVNPWKTATPTYHSRAARFWLSFSKRASSAGGVCSLHRVLRGHSTLRKFQFFLGAREQPRHWLPGINDRMQPATHRSTSAQGKTRVEHASFERTAQNERSGIARSLMRDWKR